MKPSASVVLTIPEPLAPVFVTDLVGNAGEGLFAGQDWCIYGNCSCKAVLYFTAHLIEPIQLGYKFYSHQAVDPNAEIVILSSRGTLYSNGQKESLAFTATFRNHPDGTLSATFVALHPDTSWVILSTPGRMDFISLSPEFVASIISSPNV